jgi:hypothetical protein
MKMNSMNRFVILVVLLAAIPVACKPKSGAGSLKAIHLANKSISLLPGRLYAPQGSGVAYENSIRLMMLPIGCSPSQIRHLEEMVQRDVESLRHIGPRIVGIDGQPIAGAESCSIFTNFAVHPWAYGALFDRPPQTRDAFMKQQWVWLAMRGRTTANSYGFAAGFDLWMNEGGIFANMPQPLVDRKIEQWDRLFNPCQRVDVAKAFGIDKREFFSCVNGDYEPRSDKLGGLLVSMLNESGQELVARIRAGEFSLYDTTGIEQAIVIQNLQPASASTGKSLNLVSRAAKNGFRRSGSVYGSSYQSRTPLFFAGYRKFGNATRPAPVQRNGQRYYSPYRNQSSNPASSAYRPRPDRAFSFPDNPNTLYISSDVSSQFRGQNYGSGSGYTTERRVNAITGEVEYVDRYRNGSAIFWQQDALGGWTRTGVGRDSALIQGPSVVRNADGTLVTDVTRQMRSLYGEGDAYSPLNTVSTAVVGPDGTTRIIDQRYGQGGQLIPGTMRTFAPGLDGIMRGISGPEPVSSGPAPSMGGSFGAALFDAQQQVSSQSYDQVDSAVSSVVEAGQGPAGSASDSYSGGGDYSSPESFVPAGGGGGDDSSPESFVPADD